MKALTVKKLALISLLVFTSGLAAAAETQPTDAERLCGYLIVKMHAARKSPQPSVSGGLQNQLSVLAELSAQIQDLEPLMAEAIADRLTFEQFQNRIAQRGKRVSSTYQAEYLEAYLRTVCADARTSATYTVGSKGKLSRPSIRVTLPQSFDASQHNYFKELLNSDSASGAAK